MEGGGVSGFELVSVIYCVSVVYISSCASASVRAVGVNDIV